MTLEATAPALGRQGIIWNGHWQVHSLPISTFSAPNPYLWVDWGLYLIQPRLVLNCIPEDGFELSILPSMPLECVGMMVHLGCQLEWSWNQEKPLGTREGVS